MHWSYIFLSLTHRYLGIESAPRFQVPAIYSAMVQGLYHKAAYLAFRNAFVFSLAAFCKADLHPWLEPHLELELGRTINTWGRGKVKVEKKNILQWNVTWMPCE